MKIFEIGQTYYTRSIGDHNCIIHVTIKARTAKTVTANVMGTEKRFRVSEWDGAECFKPWGSYSMAPTITANDTEVLRPDWKKEPEDGEECDCGDPWCEDTRSGAEWVAPKMATEADVVAEMLDAWREIGRRIEDAHPELSATEVEAIQRRVMSQSLGLTDAN